MAGVGLSEVASKTWQSKGQVVELIGCGRGHDPRTAFDAQCESTFVGVPLVKSTSAPTTGAFSRWFGGQFGKLTAQVLFFQKPLGGVAGDGHRSEHLSGLVFYHGKAHVHINLLTALVQETCNGRGSAGQRAAPNNGLVEPIPMGFAQPLRNDEIKALAEGFGGGKAEYRLGARIPESNDTLQVRKDQRLRHRAQDIVIKVCHRVAFNCRHFSSSQ